MIFRVKKLLALWLVFDLDKTKWGAADEFAVKGKVNAVVTSLFELETLEVHDEVAGKEGCAFWKCNGKVTDDWHAFLIKWCTVFINDGDTKLVVASVFWGKAKADSECTCWVCYWELLCEKSIESTLYAKFTLVVGGEVTENCYLSIHNICNM